MNRHETLLDWATHWETTAPDRVFMTQPTGPGAVREWTFAEALDEARRMAAHLRSLDLPERSQVAICSKNCSWWVLADLAIWMAGHVSVPIYPTLTADTVAYILEHSESRLLFVGKLDPVWEQMKEGVPADLPCIAFPLAPPNDHAAWDELVASHEPLADPVRRSPEEMATIIYTSGSTGRPKGVMHDFATMLRCSDGIRKVVGARETDRYLSYLPLAHGMERWLGECVVLRSGSHVFYAESLDTFVEDLQRARPTLFMSVPRLWTKFQLGVFRKLPPRRLELLLKVPIVAGLIRKKVLTQLGLDHVRFAGSGSAPISRELISWYRDLGLELLEGYGMTENFNYSHITRPGESLPGTVGRPYDDVTCRIADDGEIQVRSPGEMMGYFKQDDETRETFTEDGWLRTGDRGEVDDRDRLRITGRTKEIFKTSKGKYIAPAPIENELGNHPSVELTWVGGAGHAQPFGVIVLSEEARARRADEGQSALERELREHLEAVNRKLPSFEHLRFLAVVDDEWSPENGLLTPTMKIRRPKIEEAYRDRCDAWLARSQEIVWAS